MSDELKKATIGGGCFWCVEAVYQDLKGIHKVVSGYAGGHMDNPTYRQVTTGTTGHAEVVQLTYDPAVISYADILYVFWRTHDPTTLNRQGNDVGPQYRSIILYHDEEQKRVAEQSKADPETTNLYPNPIVTEIVPFDRFYEAEGYHQNYYNDNRNQPYCRIVIDPKVRKMRQSFSHMLREGT